MEGLSFLAESLDSFLKQKEKGKCFLITYFWMRALCHPRLYPLNLDDNSIPEGSEKDDE